MLYMIRECFYSQTPGYHGLGRKTLAMSMTGWDGNGDVRMRLRDDSGQRSAGFPLIPAMRRSSLA